MEISPHLVAEDTPRRVAIGRMVDRAGQSLLPVALGAALGFYAADQGMRLLPTLVELLLACTLLSLLLLLLGRILQGKAFLAAREGLRLRKRVVAVLVLLSMALAVRLGVFVMERPSDLTRLSKSEFETAFQIDSLQYRENQALLEKLIRNLEREGLPLEGADAVHSPAQERILAETWVSYRDLAIALDQVRAWWEDWYRYDPSRVERPQHLRAFLLTFAAELALYEKTARLVLPLLDSPNAKKFLDAPHPELGLPEYSLSHMREELLGSRDQARIVAGETYLAGLKRGLDAEEEASALGVGWLLDDIAVHLATIEAVAPIDRAALTIRADSQLLKRGVKHTWFPLQKGVAEAMGDIRTRRIGWYLIPPEQQEEADQRLLPGDILLGRKNWYMSNVGLPGFWPHAILYIGAPDKLAAWSDDPAILDWVEAESGERLTFPEYLERRFPRDWARFSLGDGPHPYRVIEAVSEGVLLNSLPHVTGDYFAGMRPRLDKLAKAQAIADAFANLGKPYDFDFDFATDNALVCSELVWRSYQPGPGKAGLNIPLVRVAGRVTLPANEIVRFYASQADDPERILDFVLFIDAVEKEGRTFFADESAFRETWNRVKWDLALD